MIKFFLNRNPNRRKKSLINRYRNLKDYEPLNILSKESSTNIKGIAFHLGYFKNFQERQKLSKNYHQMSRRFCTGSVFFFVFILNYFDKSFGITY